jgi:hypothetical protein
MKIALTRRGSHHTVTRRQQIYCYSSLGFKEAWPGVEIFSWCCSDVKIERLEKWFKEIHGLDAAMPIHTLLHEEACEGDPWVRIALDWFFKGSRMLRNSRFDGTIVNSVVPLRFKPKVAVNLGLTLKTNKLYLFAVKEPLQAL